MFQAAVRWPRHGSSLSAARYAEAQVGLRVASVSARQQRRAWHRAGEPQRCGCGRAVPGQHGRTGGVARGVPCAARQRVCWAGAAGGAAMGARGPEGAGAPRALRPALAFSLAAV